MTFLSRLRKFVRDSYLYHKKAVMMAARFVSPFDYPVISNTSHAQFQLPNDQNETYTPPWETKKKKAKKKVAHIFCESI